MAKKRPPHVGQLIEARREAKGLTRRGLALAASMNDAYLMRIEKGTVKQPSFATICAIADALGCTADELRPDRQ